MLDLHETQHVAELLAVCERVKQTQPRLYNEALRLAIYADELTRRINLEIRPGGSRGNGSTSHRAGLLSELEGRRASIECVAKGACRCVRAQCYGEALARLLAWRLT